MYDTYMSSTIVLYIHIIIYFIYTEFIIKYAPRRKYTSIN